MSFALLVPSRPNDYGSVCLSLGYVGVGLKVGSTFSPFLRESELLNMELVIVLRDQNGSTKE
jgi:hypothetical protein